MMEKKMNWRDIKEAQKFWDDKGVEFDSFFKTKVNTENSKNDKTETNVKNCDVPLPDDNFSIDEVHKVTGDGSITPKTHIHKHTVFLDKDKAMFATRYAYEKEDGGLQSDVVRFGINVKNDTLFDLISKNNEKSQQQLEKNNNPAQSKWSKVSAKKANVKEYIVYAKNNITKIEKQLVDHAKKELENKKVVIIDVLVRNNNGSIKILEEKEHETHSVVLLKQNNKLLVIDPNNATYSNILVGASNDIVCCFDNALEIYKATNNSNIGFGQHKWRDCIDIAVKLSFHIENSSQNIKIKSLDEIHYIERSELQKHKFISDITNQSSINDSIPSEIKYNVFRPQHSSDIFEGKISVVWLKVYNLVHKNIIAKVKSLKFGINDKCEQLIEDFCSKEFDSHKHSISELKNLVSVNILTLKQANVPEIVQLIGMANDECNNIISNNQSCSGGE